jgi:hypothetical protein
MKAVAFVVVAGLIGYIMGGCEGRRACRGCSVHWLHCDQRHTGGRGSGPDTGVGGVYLGGARCVVRHRAARCDG